MPDTTSPETKDRKELHEDFHVHVQPPAHVPTSDDWMYHFLLAPLARQLKPGMRVLDVGCGNGIISLFVAKSGCSVMGIDISERAVEAATRAALNLELSKSASFRAVLLEELPSQESYDIIIMSEVIEHIEDHLGALKKAHQLLKPGGKIYITTPSKRAIAHNLRMLFTGRDRFDEHVGHVRRYTIKSLRSVTEEAGFKVALLERGEGPLRNMMLTFDRLAPLYHLLKRARLNRVFESFDSIVSRLIGEAQLIQIAVK